MCDRVKLKLAAIHEHQDLLQELFVDIVITTNRDSNILGLDEALLAGEVHTSSEFSNPEVPGRCVEGPLGAPHAAVSPAASATVSAPEEERAVSDLTFAT